MLSRIRIRPHHLPVIGLLIILLGTALRLNVYVQNRSLIIDEANLARNIVERDYNRLFTTLDYEQYAPPLYSSLVKFLTQRFGVNEFVFRLPSLIAGILSLILLLAISKMVIKKYTGTWYALLLFAFSILAIRYATEFKPYAIDAAFTLGFIWWVLKTKQNGIRKSIILWWAILGALAIWFSMPVVFILASAGSALLVEARKNDRRMIPYIALMGVSWIISFGVYYMSILHHDAHSDYLSNYHKSYFFNFIPTSFAEANQSIKLLISLLRSATDQTIISLAWAGITFLTGLVLLIRDNRFTSILLAGPILLCLVTSHLKLYSLIPRLTLFMIPLILLIMGMGVSFLWDKANRVGKIALAAVMILTIANKDGYTYVWKSMEFENAKSVMQYINKNTSDDTFIFVQHDGVPAFIFYNEMYDKAWGFQNYHLAHWRESAETVIRKSLDNTGKDTFWIFLSHTFPQEHIDQYIEMGERIGVETDRFVSTHASCYLFNVR